MILLTVAILSNTGVVVTQAQVICLICMAKALGEEA